MALESYDAFISYRSTAKAQARRIKAALEGLAEPKKGDEPFQVFLDEASLLVGDLGDEIETALRGSHALIVLIARDTVESKWVGREIEFWLENGGSAERLFLIRIDDVDLAWDEETNDWAHPEQLPPPLRGFFEREQKYIDLTAMSRGIERTAVAPVFAAVRERTLESLLLEEAERARRRQRTVTLIATAISALLVLAVAAGIWALVSRNQAEAAARQAQADGLASQSVLASDVSRLRSVQLALDSAQFADTPNVRAALLGAASADDHLRFAIPAEGDVRGLALEEDFGTQFAVTSSSTDAEGEVSEVLTIFDTVTGALVAEGELPETGMVPTFVSESRIVLCSYQSGSHLATARQGTITLEPIQVFDDIDAGDGSGVECSVRWSWSGAVVDTRPSLQDADHPDDIAFVSDGGNISHVRLGEDDRVESIETLQFGGVDPVLDQFLVGMSSGWYVFDAPSGELIPVVDGQETLSGELTVLDSEVSDVSGMRTIFVGLPSGWAFLVPVDGGDGAEDSYIVSRVEAPPGVVAMAAIVDDSRFTGAAVGLTAEGSLTRSDTGETQPLTTDAVASGGALAPTIVRLGDSGRYLVAHALKLYVVSTDPADFEQGTYTIGTFWPTTLVQVPIGTPSSATPFEIVRRVCGDQVLLGLPDGSGYPALEISGDGWTHGIYDEAWRIEYDDYCGLLTANPGASRFEFSSSTDVTVNSTATSVATSSALAVTAEDGYLSVSTWEERPPVWSVDRSVEGGDTFVIGNATTGIVAVDWRDAPVLQFWDDGRLAGSVEISELLETTDDGLGSFSVAAAAPDSSELVLQVLSANGSDASYHRVNASGATPLECGDAESERYAWEFRYLPAPGFESSGASADSFVLVRDELQADHGGLSSLPDDILTACTTGERWTGIRVVHDYGLEDGNGWLTYSSDQQSSTVEQEAASAVTWTHLVWSGQGTPERRDYTPATGSRDVVFSRSGDSVAVATGGGLLSISQWDGAQWRSNFGVTSTSTRYAFVDDSLLLVDESGSREPGLRFIDVATGYQVLSIGESQLDSVGSVQLDGVREVDGELTIPVISASPRLSGASNVGATLRVPYSPDRIVPLICSIWQVSECSSTATTLGVTLEPWQSVKPWPAELSGTWCPDSDDHDCFSVEDILEGNPAATISDGEASTSTPGAVHYSICLIHDLGTSCRDAYSMHLTYFPIGVSWECTASEGSDGDAPDCDPELADAHDPSRPRLVVYPSDEPMYQVAPRDD